MSARQVLSIAAMVMIFSAFLIWLYSIGRINFMGIVLIVSTGVVFVSLTTYLYKRMWDDEI